MADREQPALERIESLEEVRDDWLRLGPATGHPFASWEWNSTWWTHFSEGRELYCFACRERSGSVTAILPLYVVVKRPFAVARFLGYADLQSPVCAPEHRALAAGAIRDVTRRPYRCRALFAERLPGDQGWAPLLGGALVHTDTCPVLRFDGRSWDDVLGTLSRKHRGNLRRSERRLVEEHGMTFRLANLATLEADMRSLFRLHEMRWGHESTGVFTGARGGFHLELATAALEAGWLRLWLAEIDREPVAAWYGFRYAGTQWHFQGGRDPRFDRLSVGSALFIHTLRDACQDGLDAYSFLAGDEPYKMRFANADPGAESRLIGSRPLTTLLSGGLVARQTLAKAKMRLRQKLRSDQRAPARSDG